MKLGSFAKNLNKKIITAKNEEQTSNKLVISYKTIY
jgi:hypothetical protein